MKKMTQNNLKHIAQEALKVEYGFAPKQSDITLLEGCSDGTYIMFHVKGIEYSFNSHIVKFRDGTDGGVWTGAGTIERLGKGEW